MTSPRPPLEPLLQASQKALKEWAVVCRALESGAQSVLLRKGGIIEETRDFKLVEKRFLLYPTYEHQDLSSVQEPYRDLFRQTLDDRPPPDVVRVTSWAEVTDLFLTFDLDRVLALAGLYAWSEDYVRMRMAYKPRKPMNLVVVRAFRLPAPVDLPYFEHYAGCKSWVPVEGDEISTAGSWPVLSDEEHPARVRRVARALDGAADRVKV